MTAIDPSKPVMVTGATGYLAGWLVKRLLEDGLTVHAAVRDPSNTPKRAHLDAIAEKAPGTIRYFQAELLTDGSYGEAMAGCELVFHTASPFVLGVEDPVEDLIEPARRGTRNVLEQATRTPSVKRVVVTSSCAAMYGDNADLEKTANGRLDESVWNTSSSITHQPYSYSKTLAEQEAWAIARDQAQWDLVTINPSLVIGPSLGSVPTSASFDLLKQFGDGTMAAGIPRFGIGVVDVRDVAAAHVAAGFEPSAHGRYIVSGHDTDFTELAAVLRRHFGDAYPFPKRVLPKWLVWLVGPLINSQMTRPIVARNVNLAFRADNRKSVRELGMEYRPLADSVVEMFQQMIDEGVVAGRAA